MIRALGLLSIVGLAGGCVYLYTHRVGFTANAKPLHDKQRELRAYSTYLDWAEKDAELFARLFDEKQISQQEYSDIINEQDQNDANNSRGFVEWLEKEKALFERQYVRKAISLAEFDEICREILQNDEKVNGVCTPHALVWRAQLGLVTY